MSVKALEKAYSDPAKVKELSLHLDQFAEHEIASLFDRIASFPVLETLSLYGSFDEIPRDIGALKKIKSLELQSSDAGRNFFPEEIGQLKSLERLDIERTDICTLPDNIGNLRNLHRISIMQTNLSAIPSSIGDLQLLEILSCSECQLTSIPKEISKLQNLSKLYLDGVFTIIPDCISELTGLTELSLDGKFICAPRGLSSLPCLTYLFLKGRFENLVRGESESRQKFSREGLSDELLNFEQVSAKKFAIHRQTVPWPIYEDSGVLQKRPLKEVPVLSSFKIVGMPGELVDLSPSTVANLSAAKAFLDGSPLVFVSDADPDTILTVGDLCQIGVMAEIIQHQFYSKGADLKLRCLERVLITEVKRDTNIVLATIDSFVDQESDAGHMVVELKDIALSQMQQHLKSIRTTPSNIDKARKSFEKRLPQVIKNNEASFLFAAVTNIKYVDKQKLLTLREERERLIFLKQLWGS